MRVTNATDTTVTIDNACPFCKKSRELVVDKMQFIRWTEGMLIQRAFPTLSSDDREHLMTGMCNDCFPSEDD